MKEFNEHKVLRVISEPGDLTRYDYLVIQNNENFFFISWRNTFEYPRVLNYFIFRDINTLEEAAECCRNMKGLKNVNQHTLLECINTIKLLKNE